MSLRTDLAAAVGVASAMLSPIPFAVAAENVAAVPSASPVGAESDQLETVVVTAQRRSENLERVPISIATVSGESLTSTGVTDVAQLSESVPGLNIENYVGNAIVFVRGVGTTALGVENDVGVYVDGVYITSQAASLLNLSNIDHVEVLRGPQGTLFGRNAVGGALSIVTKDPSETPAADVSVGYGNYNTTTANFYGTTGIATNLATDLAIYYSDQADGWGTNLTTQEPTFRSRTIQLRNKWLFTPTEDTKVTFSLDYALVHNELGQQWAFLPGAIGADGTSTYRGFYNSLANGLSQNETQQGGGMLRIEQNFSWARGVSISSIRGSTDHLFVDQDATPLTIVQASPRQNDRSYSEELQLLSKDSSHIQWIVGAFALYDKFYTPGFNIQVGADTNENLVVTEPTTSYAGFGQATFEIVTDTHLTAGLRYTEDHKSISGETILNDAALPTTIPGVTSPNHQDNNFSKLTYRIVLDHQFLPELFGYVSYDTGFKSGQYNLISYSEPAVRPEELDAWQAGLKSEFLDHRLRVNLAGFHYKYSNIQITEVVTGGTQLLNAASAEMYGMDADFTAAITANFRLQGSAEWLHGRYTNFPNAPSYVPTLSPVTGLPVGGNTLTTINASGNTTVHSPDASAYLAADYTIPFTAGRLEINGNVSYNSGYYWDPDNRLKQPEYALLGAYVKWSPPGQEWDVRIWGNNLTDKQFYAFESAYSLGDVFSPAAPRTYGITATYHF